MRILAIETSCDETAVTVLDCSGDLANASFSILGDSLFSQASLHTQYGGVYPALAKREHQANLVPLAKEALAEAGLLRNGNAVVGEKVLEGMREDEFKNDVRKFLEENEKPVIDLIAVTHGPGLEIALWTGINFAQALATQWSIPLFGIDHMEGHVVSGLLSKDAPRKFSITDFKFPLLALLISGGHTELALMKEWFLYENVGRTKDDAVGEAFDKVARLLDLPYPGGPKIEEVAARSRERLSGAAEGETSVQFPRPMLREPGYDFSFSGLKTAVLYKLREMKEISEHDKEEIAHAFEDAARDVLVEKTRRAVKDLKPGAVVVGGGVSANTQIRSGLEEMIKAESPGTLLCLPPAELTGDNSIMIGAAAYLRFLSGKKSDLELNALGNLLLEESSA